MKQKNYFTINNFHLIGRLCNTPCKDITKNKQLYTRIMLKTRFINEIYIPLIMFGYDVDIVCTKYQQGDVVAVEGQIASREKQGGKLMIDFVITSIQLISKSKVKIVPEDNFKKIIELYDPDKVAMRLMYKR